MIRDEVPQVILLSFTSALNAGGIWPPLSAYATSTPPRTKTAENKTRLSRVLRILNGTHLIHPHRYSRRGNNFISPVAACMVQSSNRGAGSVVTTVKLSSRDTSHLHQRREAADNVTRQLRPPRPQLFVYTSPGLETCRVLLGLGNCVVCNTNRRATLSPWRRGLQLTGEGAVTQPNCCIKICICAIYTNQNVGWVRLNLDSVKVLQLLVRFSWVKEIEWREREGEREKWQK